MTRNGKHLITGSEDAVQHASDGMGAREELDAHDGTFASEKAGVDAVEGVSTEVSVCITVRRREVMLCDTFGTEGFLDAAVMIQGLQVDAMKVRL